MEKITDNALLVLVQTLVVFRAKSQDFSTLAYLQLSMYLGHHLDSDLVLGVTILAHPLHRN